MHPHSPYYQFHSNQPQQSCLPATPFIQSQPTTSPHSTPVRHFGWDLFQQPKQVVSLAQDDPYSCNFIGQLQGSYEIDSISGTDFLTVIVPETNEMKQPYAIVRRVCDDGEALPDQFIYEEQMRFILRDAKGNVVAMMPKGINMKHNIKWELRDGREALWRRSGDVCFSLVSVDALSSCSRRNSISSVYSTTPSVLCNSLDNADQGIRGVIRPELLQTVNVSASPCSSRQSNPWTEKLFRDKTNFSLAREEISDVQADTASKKTAQEDRLFEQIKTYCIQSPCLMKRVMI